MYKIEGSQLKLDSSRLSQDAELLYDIKHFTRARINSEGGTRILEGSFNCKNLNIS